MKMKLFLLTILLLTSSCVPLHFEASGSWGEGVYLHRTTTFKQNLYDPQINAPIVINKDSEDFEK